MKTDLKQLPKARLDFIFGEVCEGTDGGVEAGKVFRYVAS